MRGRTERKNEECRKRMIRERIKLKGDGICETEG
jgi:hypothetical protein